MTIGFSICHPEDEFNEQEGINVAKRRIREGEDVGSIFTWNVTMLTKDAIEAELKCKLAYICQHIDDYIPYEIHWNTSLHDATK